MKCDTSEGRTRFGVDVAHTRTDDLDKLMIRQIAAQRGVSVLDLGSGAGGQSVRLAEVGARVVAVDIQDYSPEFQQLRAEYSLSEDQLRWVQSDVRQLSVTVTKQRFSVCCMQRTLHYVRYTEAEAILTQLKSIVTRELYISVTGLETAIADCYPAVSNPIESRFERLSAVGCELFVIHEPMCLYAKAEFEQLLTTSGWKIERCWTSAFGNHKAVCR